MSRIVVTGMGVITAIGAGTKENHASLVEGKCGIGRLELFSTRYAELLPFAEIKITDDALKRKLNVTEQGLTRTDLLAQHAFAEAIADAGISGQDCHSFSTALIGASTVGGMCLTDELFHDSNRKEKGSSYLASYDSAASTIHLQKLYGINGIVNTFNTACSSSANAIAYGARLIKHGFAERAIVGGADSLAKFTINGFNALHILSKNNCAPFDAARDGLNLGEGAAFLVLEKEETAKDKKIYAELSGYCNSNDAYHPSSLSDNGDGPYLSMKGALESGMLFARDISFINAHGTGTENNDWVESRAMLRLFETPPPFASTKSFTGHTLGAAGAIEAVYSVLSIYNQDLYPSLNFKTPIQDTALVPLQAYAKAPVEHVMSNSFGFGGNCTSLIFSQYPQRRSI